MTAVPKKAHVWERDSLDWYVEPRRVTEQLLEEEGFSGRVHDPACGGGNIVSVLLAAGYEATGSDIKLRMASPPWWRAERDFLNRVVAPLDEPKLYENIVTNPPFFRAKGAEAFIRKALEVATGKVAVFVDIRFLTGDGRANGLFAEHAPHRIWIVTPRASCPPGSYLAAGNKAGNGSADWCWLVWDLTAPAVSVSALGWLRQSKDAAA